MSLHNSKVGDNRATHVPSATGAFTRAAIVELTGDEHNPFWVRYLD